jgi:hypothetical protein
MIAGSNTPRLVLHCKPYQILQPLTAPGTGKQQTLKPHLILEFKSQPRIISAQIPEESLCRAFKFITGLNIALSVQLKSSIVAFKTSPTSGMPHSNSGKFTKFMCMSNHIHPICSWMNCFMRILLAYKSHHCLEWKEQAHPKAAEAPAPGRSVSNLRDKGTTRIYSPWY